MEELNDIAINIVQQSSSLHALIDMEEPDKRFRRGFLDIWPLDDRSRVKGQGFILSLSPFTEKNTIFYKMREFFS